MHLWLCTVVFVEIVVGAKMYINFIICAAKIQLCALKCIRL